MDREDNDSLSHKQRQMESNDINLKQQVALTEIRDWCMSRISLLSLADDHEDAQALTQEHMEMLRMINPDKTLWMTIEKSA